MIFVKKNVLKTQKETVIKKLINHFFIQYKDFYHLAFLEYWFKPGKKYQFSIDVGQGQSVFKSFKKHFSEDLTKKEILEI